MQNKITTVTTLLIGALIAILGLISYDLYRAREAAVAGQEAYDCLHDFDCFNNVIIEMQRIAAERNALIK